MLLNVGTHYLGCAYRLYLCAIENSALTAAVAIFFGFAAVDKERLVTFDHRYQEKCSLKVECTVKDNLKLKLGEVCGKVTSTLSCFTGSVVTAQSLTSQILICLTYPSYIISSKYHSSSSWLHKHFFESLPSSRSDNLHDCSIQLWQANCNPSGT